MRSGPGFDLTLALAVAHAAAFALLLARAEPAFAQLQVNDQIEVDKLDETVKYGLE
jgi:hypothetical protein